MTMTPEQIERERPLRELLLSANVDADGGFAKFSAEILRQLSYYFRDLSPSRPTPVRALRERAGRA